MFHSFHEHPTITINVVQDGTETNETMRQQITIKYRKIKAFTEISSAITGSP